MRTSDILRAYTLGQTTFRSFVKTPSQSTAAGIWFDLSLSSGNPVPQYYFAVQATALTRSADGGLDHGPDVPAGHTKYLHKLTLQATSVNASPLSVEILDYLMFYGGVAMDVGVFPLTTNIALPRFPTGAGVQIMVIEQNSYIGGAQFTIRYTNSQGVSGRTTPAVRCNTQTVAGTVATSAPGTALCAGRFMPLQDNDTGVRLIESVDFSTGDVGLLALCLVMPVGRALIFEPTAPVELDFLTEIGYLPTIQNDAYLNLIVKPAASLAGTAIYGDLTTLWSNT